MSTGELVLVSVAFATSAVTAITGIGGGILLISVMVQFMAPGVAVPVHGLVQLASNASRAGFGRPHIRWRFFFPYAAGALVGAAAGSRVVVALDARMFSIVLGVFVLVLTWMPRIRTERRFPGKFFLVGGGACFLSMFVGATGPLSAPFFLREGLKRDELVVTHAACMSSLHACKVAAFFAVGFALGPNALLLGGMLASTVLGSWAGTRLRGRLDERLFRHVFRWIVTLLGVRLIVMAVVG